MNIIAAPKLRVQPDTAGLPGKADWAEAPAIAFCSDWRAANADPERQTEVRILWAAEHFYIQFHCRFREIFTYEGSDTHRDMLWMRDVAEIFIRPDDWEPSHYLEFEISPNGDWLDLDISPGKKSILYCGMKSRVVLDAKNKTWTAELAIPSTCFSRPIKSGETWRLNLFRIEGRDPNRFYSAWIPTHTLQPNFHVPELFGSVHFQD